MNTLFFDFYKITNYGEPDAGLRVKPTYEQLVNVAVSDELENVKFPNRTAKFLREGFVRNVTIGWRRC